MQCNYYGQDILATALGLATYIATSNDDAAYLNYVGNLLMLTGQQIVTIASAQAYYCNPATNTDNKNKKPLIN